MNCLETGLINFSLKKFIQTGVGGYIGELFMTSLLAKVKCWKQFLHSSAGERADASWYIHAMNTAVGLNNIAHDTL